MIELSDIIRFISFTVALVLIDYLVYGYLQKRIIPVSMSFSAILSIVWSILL